MDENMQWILKTDSILYNSLISTIRPMQIYGMYPINDLPKWFFYIHGAFLHCVLTLPSPLLSFVYLFVNMDSMELDAIIDLLFMTTEVAVTVVKYLPMRMNPDKIRHSLEWLNIKEFKSYHKDQERIAKNTSNICRQVFIQFTVASLVTLFLWAIKPFIIGDKKFPNMLWLPFDAYQNDYLFAFVYFMEVLGISNACLGNCSLNCLVVGLIHHAAGQIKIIKGTLRDIIKHNEEKISYEQRRIPKNYEMLKNKYIYEEICRCVDRYNLVKEFAKEVEDTYSFPVFSQFITSVFVICFACVQFFFVELWSIKFYVAVIWTTVMTWEVFLYCYFGALLYYETSSFVSDIYLTDWLDLDQKCQRALIIMMENAKRPLMIKAEKFIDLSLETFATIMRRSYSLLAMLNNFK